MDEYIQYLNNTFNDNSRFKDLNIEIIISDSFKFKSTMAEIFKKYNALFWDAGAVTVSEEDCSIILKNLNNADNVLIKAYEHCLISSCKSYYEKNELLKLVNEYINWYFLNIDDIESSLPIFNMKILLSWTKAKFSRVENEKLYIKIFSYIKNGNKQNFHFLFATITFIEDIKGMQSIDLEGIYKKYMKNTEIKKESVYFYYDCYKKFLDYYKSDRGIRKIIMKDLINFSLKWVDFFDDWHIQIEFQKIRQYMDELKDDYTDADYMTIDNSLKKANAEALSKLKYFEIKLPGELKMKMSEEIERLSKIFQNMNSKEQINYLMFQTFPFSINEIKETIAKRKKGSIFTANECILDENGRIINFDEMKEKEYFSLKSREYCFTTINIYLDCLYSIFLKYLKTDDCFQNYLKYILSSNIMVSDERISLLCEQFNAFFKGDYRNSVFDIVFEFEESLRHYFSANGMNIKKRNGTGDVIGTNTIFNNYEKNSYRDKLLETIDENYYFTLKWLLTDKYGFDFRDKSAHRINATYLYKTCPAVYTVLHIFRIYWFMQNSKC